MPGIKIYYANRRKTGSMVFVNGSELSSRWDLISRSTAPQVFAWGCEGYGPSQLALAILCDFLQNDEKAVAEYQQFNKAIVSKLPHEKWELTSTEIAEYFLERQAANLVSSLP